MFNKKKLNLVTSFIIAGYLLLTSCVGHKELEYIQDPNKSIKSFNESNFQDYKLKPNDELYIHITSLDEASNLFNSNPSGSMAYIGMEPYSASLLSYTVNTDGYIQIPILRNLYVKDKTISDLTRILKDSLSRILNQPSITIKLVNRYVSVLGAVKSPGHYTVAQEKISIFDALSFAGDITDFGNRKEVILVREENGKNLRITLDLTQSSFLSSDYYYLRPNDIIYVSPLRKYYWGFNQFPFAIILSAITTGILVVSYVK